MGFSEMGSDGEWGEPTDDTIWQFADAMDISRFERFGLTDATLFRLDVLRRNCNAFGIHSEQIGQLSPGSGCWLLLYGCQFLHRVAVDGDVEPAGIWLYKCNLDQAESWTPCFQGRDIPGDWFSLLLQIATAEDIGFFGTEGIFEVPR